jgi:TatD DNase family protein
MKLFDSHCHLDDQSYDIDLDHVIERSKKAGVEAIMVVGVTEKSSRKAVALAKPRHGLYASVGIHPHDAKETTPKTLDCLKTLAKDPKVKAWGETGLDFNRMYSTKKDQERSLVNQLEIADELNLPLIFHERESKGRLIEILNAHPGHKRKGVVHCFSGNKAELIKYLDLGFYIGVTGILTIKGRGKDLRKLVTIIPDDRILVETDAPYLTPAPEKNNFRRNEPAFVKSTLLRLAEVRGEDPEHFSSIIWENTCKLYDISIE